MEGLGSGSVRKRSLSEHALLQQLQRGHESLLALAVAASRAECLVLLPEESQLKGFQLDRVFLETHVLQQTAYSNLFVNLRGQEVERRGDELITSLGFRAKVSVSILREERMFESGCAFSCLLVSSPLLPLPPGRRGGEVGALSVSSRRPHGGTSTGGGPHGPPVSAEEALLSSLSSTETQLRVERLWKQGPQGPLAERLVHAEIMRFKNTHVLVPGFDAALAQRIGQLITACCRQVPSTLTSAKEAYRLLERFVWLELYDKLWPFFLEAGEVQQAAMERGLEVVRMDPAAAATDLGLRRELRVVAPSKAGKELLKLSSLVLPHEKLQQLSLAVRKIYEACDAAVAAANSRASVGVKQRQPVEVACDDLVALLVLAVADSGGEALVASYLHMSVLLLQQVSSTRDAALKRHERPSISRPCTRPSLTQQDCRLPTHSQNSQSQVVAATPAAAHSSSSSRQRQTLYRMQQRTATDAKEQQPVEAARGPKPSASYEAPLGGAFFCEWKDLNNYPHSMSILSSAGDGFVFSCLSPLTAKAPPGDFLGFVTSSKSREEQNPFMPWGRGAPGVPRGPSLPLTVDILLRTLALHAEDAFLVDETVVPAAVDEKQDGSSLV
ncbi:hypothetical protein Esti_002997 [Eimeria stiedai]